MSVIVRVGQVDDGENIYKAGDIIEGLSEIDEQELLAAGVVDVFEQHDFDELKEDKKPVDPPAGDKGENESDDESKSDDETTNQGPDISIPGLESPQKNKRAK